MLKKLMTAVLAFGLFASVSATDVVAPVVTEEEVKVIVAEILNGSVTDASDAMTKIKALSKDKRVQIAAAIVAGIVALEVVAFAGSYCGETAESVTEKLSPSKWAKKGYKKVFSGKKNISKNNDKLNEN